MSIWRQKWNIHPPALSGVTTQEDIHSKSLIWPNHFWWTISNPAPGQPKFQSLSNLPIWVNDIRTHKSDPMFTLVWRKREEKSTFVCCMTWNPWRVKISFRPSLLLCSNNITIIPLYCPSLTTIQHAPGRRPISTQNTIQATTKTDIYMICV